MTLEYRDPENHPSPRRRIVVPRPRNRRIASLVLLSEAPMEDSTGSLTNYPPDRGSG
jgi:hypothetical protein